MMLPAIAPIIPELILAGSALLLLIFGAFRGDRSAKMVAVFAVVAMATSAGSLFLSPLESSALNNMLAIDGFGRFVKIFILFASGISLLLSLSSLEENKISRPEYSVLVLFAALGMMLMVSSRDMLSLYASLELQSFPLYVLVAFRRDNVSSSEAGLKYFVLGALASGILLYGISLLYGYAGATDFSVIASALKSQSPPMIVIFGLVFVCVGFAFKISAAPFHMWAPDVYEGAPVSVTAFIAVAPKIAVFALIARVLMGSLGSLISEWQQILVVLSAVSMVIGGFAGLAQTSVKRLMAYSTISNVGFMLMALAVGGEAGVQVTLIYLVIYAINTLGAFAVILCLRRKGQVVDKIEDFSGFSKTHPGLALAMAVFMFSLAGVPPMAGFFGKYFALLIAVNVGLLPLVIIGVLMGVIAAYYYLRIVKIMYFDEVGAVAIDPAPEASINLFAAFAAALVALFIFYPTPLVDNALVAAKNLLGS